MTIKLFKSLYSRVIFLLTEPQEANQQKNQTLKQTSLQFFTLRHVTPSLETQLLFIKLGLRLVNKLYCGVTKTL